MVSVYHISVSNSAGVALSSNAGLRVFVPQQFTGPPARLGDGSFRLLFRDVDGSLMTTNGATNLVVEATTNLTSWLALTNGFKINNGSVQVDDPDSASLPRRFYRIIER